MYLLYQKTKKNFIKLKNNLLSPTNIKALGINKRKILHNRL